MPAGRERVSYKTTLTASFKPDISVAKSKLGWEPRVPLAEGLTHTIAYFDGVLSNFGGLNCVDDLTTFEDT